MWLLSWRWKRCIFIIYELCLTNFVSITSNWSWQSVNSLKVILTTWVITSQRMGLDNLKAIAECTLLQTYTDIQAFLGLVGHYRRFIEGSACIAQPLHEYLSRDGAGRKSEPVTVMEEALHAFGMLNEPCITVPMLAFADFKRSFLLETNALKEGLGDVLLQKQVDSHYHPVAYISQELTTHEQNYQSSKLEFQALKWVITEHFQEYLPWKPFTAQTDNNPLTYNMTMPNSDATRHHWVESVAQYTFHIKNQKGHDNTVADVLNRITTRLNTETVKSILYGVSMGAAWHEQEPITPLWSKLEMRSTCRPRKGQCEL